MKRSSLIANLSIALVLVVLSVAVFSADLGRIYSPVAAPIQSGNKAEKNVSFMICVEADTDGAALDAMCGALSARSLSATFFVAGNWVMKNPLRLKNMLNIGFEVSNLGFSGKSFKTMKAAAQKQEILDTHTIVKGMTGIDMKLFTPPAGEYNKDTLKTASALGYTTVCASKLGETAKNGDLILLCPRETSVQDFETLLDSYIQQGFGLVKVSDNIAFV